MKNLPITPDMQARINAAAGTEVNPATIMVYEALAFSRDPVVKPGSIFNGYVADPAFYSELAAYVNGGKSVTVQIMHETGDLPTGRVFHAAEAPDGTRAQFYVPNDKSVVPDIENGLVGQVSIGAVAKQLLCSECQWDYRGADATIMNFIDQTCANGHTIGDGTNTHLVGKGVDTWFELSLCGTGASPGAKIMSRAKAMLTQEDRTKLAASGVAPEAIILVTPPTGEEVMDLKALTDKVADQATENARLTAALTAATATKEADTAKIAELTAAVAGAETAKTTALADVTAKLTIADAKVIELTTANTAAVAELAEAKTFLTAQAGAGLTASGKKVENLPNDVKGLVASLEASGVNIANLVAQTRSEKRTTMEAAVTSPASAFQTRK